MILPFINFLCYFTLLSLKMGHKAVGTVSMTELYINKKHFNIKHLAQISKILDIDICSFFEGVNEIIKK